MKNSSDVLQFIFNVIIDIHVLFIDQTCCKMISLEKCARLIVSESSYFNIFPDFSPSPEL